MIQIRKNCFETNSSSTHSLVIGIKSDMDDWYNDKKYYCNNLYSDMKDKGFEVGKFYDKEEVEKVFGKDLDTYCFCTYSQFDEYYELEGDTHSYTTPSGETVIIEARFGYDG